MRPKFKPGSTADVDFTLLSDLRWHCTKCELKSGQAKTWQVWRQTGIQLDIDEKGNFFKNTFCQNCNRNTVHRKLKSLDILVDTKVRSGIATNVATKIKLVLGNIESVYLRKMPSNLLEVDHKFPQIRWSQNEPKNEISLTDVAIKQKFMLLTRSHNLLKSRNCEKCFRSGHRGCFPGVNFWYQGTSLWDTSVSANDQRGCVGCFWYDPSTWREELNKKINK